MPAATMPPAGDGYTHLPIFGEHNSREPPAASQPRLGNQYLASEIRLTEQANTYWLKVEK
jgi:hypothetical protein